ncbi:MAG: transketolase C-terminal domain-containing protein [Patescibacteria group bacterium]
MRKQLVATVERILNSDDKAVLLLGDIGVFGFRNVIQNLPDRAYNIGILEQSTIGLAAGLAKSGFIPIIHTIAPFLIERSLEQLKLDFGYQALGGNFISVGASYDYAALGCTHHCPGDVGELKNIPGMEIVLPGTKDEFDRLFSAAYDNGHPTYFRLSEDANNESYLTEFGKAVVVKKGKLATVIAVGTMLQNVVDAAVDLDVTILYYNTVSPFDSAALLENFSSKILLCEPYYEGGLVGDILKAVCPNHCVIDQLGVPHNFLRTYGTANEHSRLLGFTPDAIRNRINKLISA